MKRYDDYKCYTRLILLHISQALFCTCMGQVLISQIGCFSAVAQLSPKSTVVLASLPSGFRLSSSFTSLKYPQRPSTFPNNFLTTPTLTLPFLSQITQKPYRFEENSKVFPKRERAKDCACKPIFFVCSMVYL